MNFKVVNSFFTILLAASFSKGIAQADPLNVTTTAVPFLRISPDARAGAMGDVGVATSADATAGFWNMGKVVFNESTAGVAVTYTPWLKDLVSDVYLLNAAGYYKLNEQEAITAGLRYFSLGQIQFTDALGNALGSSRPREFAFDFGYSRKLTERLGLGVALRYVNSDLAAGASASGSTFKAGNAVAGDIGVFYDGKDENGSGINLGASLTNLGSKIAYTNNADEREYIPANLGLGAVYTSQIDDQNSFSIGMEVNKTLVPSLAIGADQAEIDAYRKEGVFGSWFKSFNDFPGQASISAGAEYWYNNQFALRAGYFYEDKTRGNRRYFTAGVGLKYNIFGLNFSYLAATGNTNTTRNPLANTLRFSILFDLGAEQ